MEWWQMWLILSICLYIGARAGVGLWLNCFAAALISAGGAVLRCSPLGQVQLFLGGALGPSLPEKLKQLRDRF